MAERFDPAPHDRHAADPMKASIEDQEMHDRLLSGLIGSFPASDPPSVSQPSSSRHDAVQSGNSVESENPDQAENSLWARITGIFR
jgi:hypothetical protein